MNGKDTCSLNFSINSLYNNVNFIYFCVSFTDNKALLLSVLRTGHEAGEQSEARIGESHLALVALVVSFHALLFPTSDF